MENDVRLQQFFCITNSERPENLWTKTRHRASSGGSEGTLETKHPAGPELILYPNPITNRLTSNVEFSREQRNRKL